MRFIKLKKLTSQESCVVKKTISLLLFTICVLKSQDAIQIELKNGKTVDGNFIGTYMQHIHFLIGENINYIKCDEVQSITKNHVYRFDYDCSKNTVTVDILFPPQLNPMTGEWETIIPDAFDPKKRETVLLEKPVPGSSVILENSTNTPLLKAKKGLSERVLKTKKPFQETIEPKLKTVFSNPFSKKDVEENYNDKIKTNEETLSLSVASPNTIISNLSEDEIRKFIKKEVQKEVRKALPYEIRRHKEQRQNKLFQNILFGCGAWFLFMIMLS